MKLNKKGYFLALKYLSLGGSNEDLIYAAKKLKESVIADKLKLLNKIIIWVFSICYFILYFIEFIYNVRIFQKFILSRGLYFLSYLLFYIIIQKFLKII